METFRIYGLQATKSLSLKQDFKKVNSVTLFAFVAAFMVAIYAAVIHHI